MKLAFTHNNFKHDGYVIACVYLFGVCICIHTQTKQRKRLPESVHPVQPTILLNPMATSDLSPSEDEETEEEDYWSRDAFYQRSFRITAE